MAGSPPKPWERTNSDSTPPALPPKPNNLIEPAANSINPTTGYSSPYSAAGPYSSRYSNFGTSPGFGGYGVNSAYGGGFSRFGGMGSFGGFGGYEGFGGGMGGRMGYGGMNGYGAMGMNGPFDPSTNQPTLSQTLTNSTQSTFQLLESLVMAFSGFSQLLESTFMMTHSSFFTFIQLIEQFNLFKFSIGKILSLFDLLKWFKAWITGTQEPSSNSWSTAFKNFDPRTLAGSSQHDSTKPPRPSRKPIVIFFMTIFGIPYLMNKLVRSIMAKQKQQASLPRHPLDPSLQNEQHTTLSIDPSKLTFVKAIHPYHPATNDLTTMTQTNPMEKELRFEKNEVIAVLVPTTPEERQSMGWWKGRTRDGRIGWFPQNYVQEIFINQPGSSAALPKQQTPQRILPSNDLEIDYQKPNRQHQSLTTHDQSVQKNSRPSFHPSTPVGQNLPSESSDSPTDSDGLSVSNHLQQRPKFGLSAMKY